MYFLQMIELGSRWGFWFLPVNYCQVALTSLNCSPPADLWSKSFISSVEQEFYLLYQLRAAAAAQLTSADWLF